MAGAILVLLVSTGAVSPALLMGRDVLPCLQNAYDASGIARGVNIVMSAVIGITMLLLIIIEITLAAKRPEPLVIGMSDSVPLPAGKTLNKQDILIINTTEKGTTSIDVQSLCDLVENVAETLKGVHRFDCRIGKSPGGLMLYCRALIALGGNAVDVAERSRKRVIEAVEQLTELKVQEVDIKIIYDKAKKEAELLTVQ
jgi:hypothetical protein